ncbi:hypothetical protein C8J56DRAFT_1058793 [Mycena floridula]|nr:hypothetical protein C8J56DRAFT_1058793 [Mycena floridula]
MARSKLYHSAAERRAANALYNRNHHKKHKNKINRIRKERYQENKRFREAQEARKEKTARLAAKKRRIKAKRCASLFPVLFSAGHPCVSLSDAQAQSSTDQVLIEHQSTDETTPAAKVFEEFQSFTVRNPRRFLQAVVEDYLQTKHKPSIFATVQKLQSFVNRLNANMSPQNNKMKESLTLVAGWAIEIRIEVHRSYDFTLQRFQSCCFSFQQDHDNDGLGFTVE